jgi:hypothetical protein
VAKASPPLNVRTYWPNMFGAATLADMYTDEVVQRIRRASDQVVVVSSGPDAAMRRFADMTANAGRQMVLYATWADNPMVSAGGMAGFRTATQALVDRARSVEREAEVPVVPSGLIYYDLIADPVDFAGLRPDYLWVPGSSIQNDLGTLVNVSAIYAVTTGRSPVGLPCWEPFDQDLVRQIEERVWRIVRDWRAGEAELKPAPPEGRSTPAPTVMPDDTAPPAWPAILEDGDRVFWVGNSFIGTEGGLENHFRRLVAAASPALSIRSHSRIFWGQGLGRMRIPDVVREIASGRNDVVVVTSGPSGLLRQFRDDITRAGAQMEVHMTWGRNPAINDGGLASFRERTEGIVRSAKEFERETGVPVAPCGLVFYDLIVDPPLTGLRLDWVFMVDNIHQNHIGSMANAATHYAVMMGRSPVGLPMWDPYPPELVKAVQERAWQIVQDWKADRFVIKPLPEGAEER